MKALKNVSVLLFFIFIVSSCSKGSESGSGNPQSAPSALVITATPATDGSGNVSFTATAVNAVTYIFEYGNGNIETVPTGLVTYRYAHTGSVTYTVNVTAKSSSGLTVSKTINVTVNISVGGAPVLVFADEFNVDGAPNAAKWGYETGAGGWGNNELQYYTSRPENVIVQGGVLKIKAVKENYMGSSYTSARLLTRGKYSFKYGRIEIRAKFPTGVGTWPAAWMMGDNIGTVGWPECGETDIAEHLGRDLNKIYGTLHYPGRSGGNANGATLVIPDATTAFHTYTVEWSATSIKIYVDAQLYHTVANSPSIPFNHNFFILLNMAMGGNFGGAIDPAFTSATYEVDYVRVYQ